MPHSYVYSSAWPSGSFGTEAIATWQSSCIQPPFASASTVASFHVGTPGSNTPPVPSTLYIPIVSPPTPAPSPGPFTNNHDCNNPPLTRDSNNSPTTQHTTSLCSADKRASNTSTSSLRGALRKSCHIYQPLSILYSDAISYRSFRRN